MLGVKAVVGACGAGAFEEYMLVDLCPAKMLHVFTESQGASLLKYSSI